MNRIEEHQNRMIRIGKYATSITKTDRSKKKWKLSKTWKKFKFPEIRIGCFEE